MLLDVKRVGCVGARRLGAMMLGAMMLVPLLAGCRGGDSCVPVSRTVTGEPRTKYDEFTQISWLTSWFVLTPDSEWERWRQEPEVPIRWSIEMWFRGASNVPYIDVTLRALCSHRQSEAKEAGCVNCDNLCNADNGWVELLADGVPVHMPKARYERVPIGAPEQGGPKTWASTISLRLSPQALAPLERAQTVKMRVCGALPVTFVERQAALAVSASERARSRGLTASHRVADVLHDHIEVPHDGVLVGLHACGALGDAAIAATLGSDARAMALIPCCYHYQPGHTRLVARSNAGRAAPLDVVPQQLRFATAEEVAAPGRRRRGREREEAFRLALDELLREARGEDTYQHAPPVPRSWLTMPFSGWARRVAAEHQLELPARWDADRHEARGWERARLARALGLARTPFRRALELWYVLDRALWLADAGWRVHLRTACDRRMTPRNLIIVARR